MKEIEEKAQLLDLPEEIIEIITSYLVDLMDLKMLSQSCRYLNEICGKRIAKYHKIKLVNILTALDLITFKNSQRKYENLEFDFVNIGMTYGMTIGHSELEILLETALKQIKLFTSIDIKSITLNFRRSKCDDYVFLQQISRHLVCYTPNLEEICFVMNVTQQRNIPNIIDCFQMYKLAFKLHLDFCLSKKFHGIEPYYDRCTELKGNLKVELDQEIEDVKHIIFDGFSILDVIRFTVIGGLHTIGCKGIEPHQPQLINLIIQNNKETLKVLALHTYDPSAIDQIIELPCQLRSFLCSCLIRTDTKITIPLLVNQRNLRDISLCGIELTDNLLESLAKQIFLSKLSLTKCYMESSLDTRKFEFIKDVLHIKLDHCDLTIVEVILENADKCISFKYADSSFVKVLTNKPKKVFKNLKVLEVSGDEDFGFLPKQSEHFVSRIEAPILEECSVNNCIPYSLFGSRFLKKIEIGIEVVPQEVGTILENLDSLETFYMTVRHTGHLKRSLQYVLLNLNDIVHFRFDCIEYAGSAEVFERLVDTTLKNLEVNYNFEKAYKFGWDLPCFYKNDYLSFEIHLIDE